MIFGDTLYKKLNDENLSICLGEPEVTKLKSEIKNYLFKSQNL